MTADSKADLTRNGNENPKRISVWMAENDVKLASGKTYALIIIKKIKRDGLMFTIDNVSTMPGNSNKYLEVLFATRGSIRGFIRSLKRQRTGRQNNIYLIPNIGGPICLKRAMLASVVHSMLLYGAPICERTLKVEKNRRCCKAPTRRFCCNFSGYNRDPVPRPNDAGEKTDEWRNGQGNYKTLKRQNSAYLAGKMTRLYGHRGVE